MRILLAAAAFISSACCPQAYPYYIHERAECATIDDELVLRCYSHAGVEVVCECRLPADSPRLREDI